MIIRVSLPEEALEVDRRLLEELVQTAAPMTLCLDARRRLLVLERDPEALGEPLHNPTKSRFSVSRTKEIRSPPFPQPKQ